MEQVLGLRWLFALRRLCELYLAGWGFLACVCGSVRASAHLARWGLGMRERWGNS